MPRDATSLRYALPGHHTSSVVCVGPSPSSRNGTMRLTLVWLLCSSYAAYARNAGSAQPQPSQSNQLAAQKPATARTPLDAIQTTCSSFLSVGGVCFVWSTGSSLFKRTPFRTACSVGVMSARKWGGTSAGFSGGRAIGQVIRGGDDIW
eukprot:4574460-Pleurochrysis_carterae.AAC.5